MTLPKSKFPPNRHTFVYLTTNGLTGEQYIGGHTGDLNVEYFGSGTLIKKALKEYGKGNFKRKVLEFCEPSKKHRVESKYIKKYNTLQPNGYNIHPNGGQGGLHEHSNETKQQISQTLKNNSKKSTR